MLSIILMCLLVGVCSGSQINATELAEAPPLYALDDWSKCQRANDVYCIVEAALVPTQSPVYEVLKKYSSNIGKHYNRTILHRGVCISRCGGQGSELWYEAAKTCVNQSLVGYELEADVLSVGWCNRRENKISTSAFILNIVFLMLLAITLLCTGLHLFGKCFGGCEEYSLVHLLRLLRLRREAIVEIVAANVLYAMVVVLALLIYMTTLPLALLRFSQITDNSKIILLYLLFYGPRLRNKYILAFSIKHNWQSLTHVRSKFKAESRMRDLSCLEGIRFLGTLGVISTHVTLVHVYSFIDNPEFIENLFEHVSTQLAFNLPIWMQAFFSVSGFLSAYFTLIYAEQRSFTFGKCILSFINRFIRLTPVSMAAIWFTIAYPGLGSGPQWPLLMEREAQDCSERWWYHLIYVHNYLPLGKYCMGHTWYLAVDMQLHVLGMLLLLFFLRWRKLIAPVIIVLTTGSILAAGLVSYFYNLSPIITAQTPEVVSNMFRGSDILPKLYLPVWMNVSGYLFGLATAFIYHHNLVKGTKLNEIKWFNVLFHISLVVSFFVTLAGVAFLAEHKPPRWASILYSSLDRVLVALLFNIFLLGCLSNCKSVARDALSWRGFHVLGRLSYSVFIVHFIIMRMTVASNTQIGHISLYSMMSLMIVATFLSYFVAIPVYLLIEMPGIQLWKAALGGSIVKKQDSEINENPVSNKMNVFTKTDNGEV